MEFSEKEEQFLMTYIVKTLSGVEVAPGVTHYVIEDVGEFVNKFTKQLEKIGYGKTKV